MRAWLIINPVSGDSEPNTEKAERILQALAGAPAIPEILFTTEERPAAEIARQAVEAGIEIVLVGGGDGTVSEVARELVNTSSILGVLPIGTFNNFARSLDIPTDLLEACRVIVENHVRTIDVGIANESQIFFEAAGAGLDAALFPLGEEIKGGRWMRLLEFFRLTFRYQPPKFRLTFQRTLREAIPADQRKKYSSRALKRHHITRRALFVVVANGPYYGSGFTVAPGASLDDGQFTISIYRDFTKWELIRHFQSIYRGKRRYSEKIENFLASEVRIEGRRPIPVHVDGVPFGVTPLQLKTLPAALKVIVPLAAV